MTKNTDSVKKIQDVVNELQFIATTLVDVLSGEFELSEDDSVTLHDLIKELESEHERFTKYMSSDEINDDVSFALEALEEINNTIFKIVEIAKREHEVIHSNEKSELKEEGSDIKKGLIQTFESFHKSLQN